MTETFDPATRAMVCALGATVAADRFARLHIGPGNAKGRVPFFIDETERTEAETMWFEMAAKVAPTPIWQRLAAGETGPFFTEPR